MFNALLSVILKFIVGIVSIVLLPLNLAINLLVPDLNQSLGFLNNFIDLVGDYLSFVISYTGLFPEVVNCICLLLIAIVMIPFTAHSFKFILKWYHILKP